MEANDKPVKNCMLFLIIIYWWFIFKCMVFYFTGYIGLSSFVLLEKEASDFSSVMSNLARLQSAPRW